MAMASESIGLAHTVLQTALVAVRPPISC
jgi:hypothetical protein